MPAAARTGRAPASSAYQHGMDRSIPRRRQALRLLHGWESPAAHDEKSQALVPVGWWSTASQDLFNLASGADLGSRAEICKWDKLPDSGSHLGVFEYPSHKTTLILGSHRNSFVECRQQSLREARQLLNT